MLTRWTISNFKSIREPVTLDLAPLTIFSGINSSGKSTFIQSILMVAQSFMAGVSAEPIALNGHLIQLGKFEDVLHAGNESSPMEIGIEYLPGDRGTLAFDIETRLVSRTRRYSVAREEHLLYPRIEFSKLRFVRKEKGSKPHSLYVKAIPDADMKVSLYHLRPDLKAQIKAGIYDFAIIESDPGEFVRDRSLERVERIAMSALIPWRLLIGLNAELDNLVKDVQWLTDMMAQIEKTEQIPMLGSNLPALSPRLPDVARRLRFSGGRARPASRSYGRVEDRDSEDLTPFYNKLTDRRQPLLNRDELFHFLRRGRFNSYAIGDFGRRLASALAEYLRDQPDFSRQLQAHADFEARLLPSAYSEAVDQINEVMGRKLYYLGPLRDDPRVIYAIPPLSDRVNIGLKGEYTAAMLDQHRNQLVTFPLPPGADFTGRFVYAEDTLIVAITEWLQRMGLVDGIDTEETAKVGYQLTVSHKALPKKLDLTSVGVGVSQTLPTLVLALLAPPDSVLIFEQPELHLHPKVQSVMADFFLGMSLMGKQCLIETHSEHLINRLRRRIVESEQAVILPDIRIYFVEKEAAASRFREVKPNEFGAIVDWPKGFFDEAESEASIILKKQLDKRRQLHEQRKASKGSG
jgi:predicted ATPase